MVQNDSHGGERATTLRARMDLTAIVAVSALAVSGLSFYRSYIYTNQQLDITVTEVSYVTNQGELYLTVAFSNGGNRDAQVRDRISVDEIQPRRSERACIAAALRASRRRGKTGHRRCDAVPETQASADIRFCYGWNMPSDHHRGPDRSPTRIGLISPIAKQTANRVQHPE